MQYLIERIAAWLPNDDHQQMTVSRPQLADSVQKYASRTHIWVGSTLQISEIWHVERKRACELLQRKSVGQEWAKEGRKSAKSGWLSHGSPPKWHRWSSNRRPCS